MPHRESVKNQPTNYALHMKRITKREDILRKNELPVKLTAMSGVVDAAPETEKKVGGGRGKGRQGQFGYERDG